MGEKMSAEQNVVTMLVHSPIAQEVTGSIPAQLLIRLFLYQFRPMINIEAFVLSPIIINIQLWPYTEADYTPIISHGQLHSIQSFNIIELKAVLYSSSSVPIKRPYLSMYIHVAFNFVRLRFSYTCTNTHTDSFKIVS